MNFKFSLRALASTPRLQILQWLKRPRRHFPQQVAGDFPQDGVCGTLIANGLRVSQPTASEHLRILSRAGLIRGKRLKKSTFYKHHEKGMRKLKRLIATKV